MLVEHCEAVLKKKWRTTQLTYNYTAQREMSYAKVLGVIHRYIIAIRRARVPLTRLASRRDNDKSVADYELEYIHLPRKAKSKRDVRNESRWQIVTATAIFAMRIQRGESLRDASTQEDPLLIFLPRSYSSDSTRSRTRARPYWAFFALTSAVPHRCSFWRKPHTLFIAPRALTTHL